MIPGFKIMDWKKFSRGINWDLVLTMALVSVLMIGISKTGIISDATRLVFSNITAFDPFIMMVIISLCICAVRAFIPTTTAVVALMTPMLAEIAEITGRNYFVLLIILAFWSASALLLVYTEPIFLITYREGCYTEGDLFKAGILPSLIMAVIISVLVPVLMSAAGLIL